MTSFEKHLADQLLALADDELILAHRNSEWCGHAPILEEDIAFANLALDEIGHAMLWYRLYAQLTGSDPESEPDRLVYFREAFEFRACQLVTLPRGDWAFSMLRQYLWDALEWVRLERFRRSSFTPLADAAAKIATEEIYHLRHTRAWIKRLGLGTTESAGRMQSALELLWPYTGQMLKLGTDRPELQKIGIPAQDEIVAAWHEIVTQDLEDAGLKIPDGQMLTLDRTLQSIHMIDILSELQQVARLDPSADW